MPSVACVPPEHVQVAQPAPRRRSRSRPIHHRGHYGGAVASGRSGAWDQVEPARGGGPEPGGGPVPARRRAATGLVVAVIVAAVLTLAVAASEGAPLPLDERLTRFTRDWADPLGWPVDVAHAIGVATAPIWSGVVGVAAVLLLASLRHRAAALLLAGSLLLGVGLTELMKLAVGRQRPPGAGQYEPDLDKSFPSGHASAGIYLYLATGLILLHLARGRGWPFLAWIGWALVVCGPLLGVTRLVLGVHWPTDILAGWAFGSLALLSCALLLWDRLHRGWTDSTSGSGERTR
jgi:undecaprenyl-diphosphatase